MQSRNEEGRAAAGLSAKCWRPMEQELPSAQPIQRNIHLDQHATRTPPEPEADS